MQLKKTLKSRAEWKYKAISRGLKTRNYRKKINRDKKTINKLKQNVSLLAEKIRRPGLQVPPDIKKS